MGSECGKISAMDCHHANYEMTSAGPLSCKIMLDSSWPVISLYL